MSPRHLECKKRVLYLFGKYQLTEGEAIGLFAQILEDWFGRTKMLQILHRLIRIVENEVIENAK